MSGSGVKLLQLRVCSVLAILLFCLLAQPATADEPADWPGVFKNAESEYYRGVYDTCIWAMSRSGAGRGMATAQCLLFAEQARDSGWYEQPSAGYGMKRMPAGWGSET